MEAFGFWFTLSLSSGKSLSALFMNNPLHAPFRVLLRLALPFALALPVHAEVLPNPTITASANSRNGVVANVFDSSDAEYRGNKTGNNTFIEFDFGTTTTIDGFVNVTRESTSSVVDACRLIFDTDSIPGFSAATDTVVAFPKTAIGWQCQGYVNRFAPVTARKVRWEVTAYSGGTSRSCGAAEMRFLNSAADSSPVDDVAVIGGSPALDSEHALGNAANGVAGCRPSNMPVAISPSVAYKSAGAGTSTFVDFDLGRIRNLTGFDWFDNLATGDRVSGFTVTFANDPSFDAPVAVRSVTGNSVFALSDTFAVVARYARYRVSASATNNPGLSEIVFYEGSGSNLPAGFSAAANPANGWLHGSKASPLAAELEPFEIPGTATAAIPCDRWSDGDEEPAFAGTAPANAAATPWGTATADWEQGRCYHAWRADHGFPIVSRHTITKAGAYNLSAGWRSHTVSGCSAAVSIVVNGATVASAALEGFAGTAAGSPTPSGAMPVVQGAAYGLQLAAGSTVDIVTVPDSSAGNVSIEAAIAETTVFAETTATVVIREFCADNIRSLLDEDGSASDWIEIYNGTGATVDLSGWALSDREARPQQWLFPACGLAHGQSLLVFASAKDALKRPAYGPNSELHTNFALSKSGEFLGLADSGGTFIHSFSPAFPAQYPDISYGLGANAITGYMSPTPGSANGPASSVPPALLAFSVPSGMIAASQALTISGQSPSHSVRYTTNGTEPTPTNGITYNGTAFTINASTTLRARAFADGVAGPLAQATYSLIGNTSQYGIDPATFTTALPILVIDGAAEPPTSKTPVAARFTLIDRSPADGRARLSDPPALATRGTINLRGQTSAGMAKKPYAIEFWDGADQDQNLTVLGMPKESDWVLYASYQFDPDFLRNILMFDLYRSMGRWAPRTRLVEVFFNTSSSSAVDAADYRGVYVLMEKIKVSPERVDIARMSPDDNSGDALTGGYIIARDKWSNSGELLTGSKSSFPSWPYADGGDFILKTPSLEAITATQRNYITNYTMECDTAVATWDRRHPTTGLHIFDYIGRNSFIDHHLLNAFSKNVDGIRISTYMEKDRGGKLRMGPVWDFDRSQDSDTDGRDDNPLLWNSDDSGGGSTDFFSVEGRRAEGWFHYLHQIPLYMQDWVDRYDQVRGSGVLDMVQIQAVLDAVTAELTAADNNGTANAGTPIARNFGRWPRNTRGTYTTNSNAASVIYGSSPGSEIKRHQTWLTQRLAFMDTWVLKKPAPSLAAGTVPVDSILNLTSPSLSGSARIYHTLDGSDPVAMDGSIAPGALEWTGPVALTSSTLITARLHAPSAGGKHSAWSAPLVAHYTVAAQPAAASNLVVSELHYHPPAPTSAEIDAGFTNSDDFEFIELRNIGSTRVNLWGARFTLGIDFDFANAQALALSELAPGETVILVSNFAAFSHRYGSAASDRVAGEFANGTKLDNAGERLLLIDAAGATILDFTYDDIAPWATAADGGGTSLHWIDGPHERADSWFAAAPDPGLTPDDYDLDGQSDRYEWLAGSDPADPASTFRVLESGYTPAGDFTLTFSAAAGHRYRIEQTVDLTAWEPLGEDIVPVVTGAYPLSVPVAPASTRRFYRVAALARP